MLLQQPLLFHAFASLPGGGYPPIRKIRENLRPTKFRIFFQVPYALSPLFLTLTKTAGGVPQQFPEWNQPRELSFAHELSTASFPFSIFTFPFSVCTTLESAHD